jgi:hypothetical protein
MCSLHPLLQANVLIVQELVVDHRAARLVSPVNGPAIQYDHHISLQMTDARFVALSAPLLSLISLVLCACYAAHMAAIEPLHPPSDSAVVVIIVLFLSCLAQWYLCKVGM